MCVKSTTVILPVIISMARVSKEVIKQVNSISFVASGRVMSSDVVHVKEKKLGVSKIQTEDLDDASY